MARIALWSVVFVGLSALFVGLAAAFAAYPIVKDLLHNAIRTAVQNENTKSRLTALEDIAKKSKADQEKSEDDAKLKAFESQLGKFVTALTEATKPRANPSTAQKGQLQVRPNSTAQMRQAASEPAVDAPSVKNVLLRSGLTFVLAPLDDDPRQEAIPIAYRAWFKKYRSVMSEADQARFLGFATDDEFREFISSFFVNRDQTLFENRIAYAEKRFGGVESDRARILIKLGMPAKIETPLPNVEVWQYPGLGMPLTFFNTARDGYQLRQTPDIQVSLR